MESDFQNNMWQIQVNKKIVQYPMSILLSYQPAQVLALGDEYYIAISKHEAPDRSDRLPSGLYGLIKLCILKIIRPVFVRAGKVSALQKARFDNFSPANITDQGLNELRDITGETTLALLKAKITARWPEAVEDVITKNENSYMVVCKSGICFNTFKRSFPKFVSQILKFESAVEFKVYSACFNSDFTVRIF